MLVIKFLHMRNAAIMVNPKQRAHGIFDERKYRNIPAEECGVFVAN